MNTYRMDDIGLRALARERAIAILKLSDDDLLGRAGRLVKLSVLLLILSLSILVELRGVLLVVYLIAFIFVELGLRLFVLGKRIQALSHLAVQDYEVEFGRVSNS